jgi:repressor LexA
MISRERFDSTEGFADWPAEGTIRVPMLGEVAAGQPLDVYSVEETLDVPESLWKGRRVFALRVRGSSMIDAGIRDGDYLIVEPCESADDGRTVVAEIDGRVTVKKIYRDGDRIRLQPANREMLPLTVSAEEVRILGLVAGVLRKFGFAARDGKAAAPAARKPPQPAARRRRGDDASLDLELNALDSQLARWRSLLAAESELAPRDRVRMSALARDLQALRDWYARTSRPGLRDALMADAKKVVQRMQRFLSSRELQLPDLNLH